MSKNRQSIRLPGYDYTQPGYYFITICTQDRVHRFGKIVDGGMRLNDAGKMVQSVWDEMPDHYPVKIDEFIIMPDHIHGIIILPNRNPAGATPRGCPEFSDGFPNLNCGGASVTSSGPGQARGHDVNPGIICYGDDKPGQARGPAPTGNMAGTGFTVGDAVHRFKTLTTKLYTDGVKKYAWPGYRKTLWQRNYWEHIVRNENELDRIRIYIQQNPQKWAEDSLNTKNEKFKNG